MAVDSKVKSPATRARRSRAARPWSRWPTWAALVSWPVLFVGQRVLDSEEGLAPVLSGIAVAGLLLGFVTSILAVRRSPVDRRAAARALAWVSGIGLAGLLCYFATTEWGREVLSMPKPKLGKPDTFADVLGVLWVGLVTLSYAATLLGELARMGMQRAERVESRRVTAAVVAGATMALAAVYGSLFTYAAGKADVSADFSYFRTARPSESTRRMIDSLEDPLRVLLFFPQLNEVGKKVEGYLRDLAKGSDMLEIEVHDRLLVPDIAEEHKVRKDGVVVLVRDKSSQTLDVGTDLKKATRTLKKLDGEFQKVLLKAMRGQRTAYLTVGHGELNESTDRKTGRTGKAISRHLESQHYKVKNLGLADGLGSEIPDDATIVIALGPKEPFLPEEVAALARYADRGGHLLLALDPEDEADLDPLARIVGIKWQQAMVVHDKILLRRRRNDSDKSILVAKRFSSHASVSTLSKLAARGAAVLLPGSAPLDKREDADSALRIDWAVKSVAGSYVDLNGDFAFDRDDEKRGTYNLIGAVSRPPAGQKKADKEADDATTGPAEMRAIVVGDADLFSDVVLDFSQTNVLLLLEAVRWLGGEESFTGEVSSEEDVQIVHTKAEDQIWFYSTIIAAPALVLGLGLLVTRRGKRNPPTGPSRGKGDRKRSAATAKGARSKPDAEKKSSASSADEDDERARKQKKRPGSVGTETLPETPLARDAKREADSSAPEEEDEPRRDDEDEA
ncbi:MAG: Gldg family protein [Deltaproteobacteria bacterium]|jgi:hypothetical protein|nr:Gldg family protein [Deltaproteobacteria bacterium]MBW2536458.1 Gldg family protein [Deltaproteobacteria bacterium]